MANKITVFTCLLTFWMIQANAQKNTITALAGHKGIWVVCGDALPKNFSYTLFRKKANADWVKIASINFPASKDALQAGYLNALRVSGNGITSLSDERLNALWDRLTSPVSANSPVEIGEDYALRQASGTAWYDAGADSAVNYTYKVQFIDPKKKEPIEFLSNNAIWPGRKFQADIKPLLVKPTRAGLYAEFEIADKGHMTTCKIYRRYYLRSDYEEINVRPIFTTRNGKLILLFNDETAVEKVPYAYMVLPLDAAGNPGDFSPEIKAFDVPQKSIAPSVVNFRAKSAEAEKAVRLSWKFVSNKNIVSVNVYKGLRYDGKYMKIATLGPNDTTYFDHNVKPIETYYYTVVLNGTYEQSPASPRIPGILKAINKNLFPPQDIRLFQKDNMVRLFWKKNETDTRAYYVYRGTGKAKIQQVGPVIITDSSVVAFTDTLPQVSTPTIFTYFIADENTSYAISPLSAGLVAYAQPPLPIPYELNVRRTAGNKALLLWPNLQRESSTVTGYMLYRRIVDNKGKEVEAIKPLWLKPLAAAINQYTDTTTAIAGNTYYYSLRSTGDNGSQSPASLEAGFKIDDDRPNPASNVRIFAAGNAIELRWDNPMGDKVKTIKILRALQGKKPQEIVQLNPGSEKYTDKDVVAGGIYYYSFIVQNDKGKLSSATPLLGIHL